MNDDDGNIYYHPERYGLEILCVEDNGAAWEFDMIVVFRALNGGALYVAHDAGCSCPTPFENYMGVADMTPVRTVEDLDRFLETIGTSTIGVPEALALRRAVVEALGGARRTPPSSTDSNPEYRARVNARERARRAADPEFRARVNEYNRARARALREDPEYRARENARARGRRRG